MTLSKLNYQIFISFFLVTSATAPLMCATCFMTSVMFLSPLASLPPRSLSAARPTQPRLNGWAVLWKTAAVLIYKPPSLYSHLCLQGSALDILNSEWGISKHTMAESATEPSIKGHSIVLCVLSSDKLCLDSCKQLKALKAFTYYAAFEWSFWNVPL